MTAPGPPSLSGPPAAPGLAPAPAFLAAPSVPPPAAPPTAAAAARPAARSWPARFGPGPSAGALVLLFWAACALFWPHLVPRDPLAIDLRHVLRPPSLSHPFGTDQLGRDVLSRVLAGARPILLVAPLATLLGTALGTALGLLAGTLGGLADLLLGWLVDALIALPLLVLALLVLSATGPSRAAVVAVIGLAFAPLVARTVRTAVRAEAAQDYVAAAGLRGEGALRIMLGEILPNIWPPVLVEATIRLGYAVFTAASLGFLGFGLQPPSPDWGLAIAENYGVLSGGCWWCVLFDAAATASLVIAVNLLADGLERTSR